MVHSMTAFARAESQDSWGEAAFEIRSVNHRYLDLSLKLPESFRCFDLAWREVLKKRLKRGKVECNLIFKPAKGAGENLELNVGLAEQLLSLSQSVKSINADSRDLSVSDILRWPEVVSSSQTHTDLQQPLTELLNKALDQLVDVRAREGEACVKTMQEKMEIIEVHCDKALQSRSEIEESYRNKLRARLSDMQADVDEARFEQELVMFLNRMDFQEELDRLSIHVQEVKRVLSQGGTVGRRLDFMMQELNREANTLASKSPSSTLTQSAVEIKVCIEQLREQIQNLE